MLNKVILNFVLQTYFKKTFKIELKLFLFVLYIVYLAFLLVKGYGWRYVLVTHISAVLIYSIYKFGLEFLWILLAPLIAVFTFFEVLIIERYIKSFQQNVPAEVVIILGHSNWLKLEAWIKPNASLDDIKLLVKYLELKKQGFSFYPDANTSEVESIMANEKVKEVYFMGHGASHTFQLNTDEILYYCDFAGAKYEKEFVHQVHCGTQDGKSLIDYVVPERNRNGCFLIRKSINSFRIQKEFKQKIKMLEN